MFDGHLLVEKTPYTRGGTVGNPKRTIRRVTYDSVMDEAQLRDRIDSLPTSPGVYLFVDENQAPNSTPTHPAVGDTRGGRILYVGKAVEIRDRVRSYLDPRSKRIAAMREQATTVTAAVTETETQALLLEANLIKQHAPRYNVRLADDKSYPMVQFTAHEVPRIEITRDPDPAATVYGPYTNRGDLEAVVKAIRQIFGLRGCSEHKYTGRDRPCLDYEMGLCSAPCTGEITPDAYRMTVDTAMQFFDGDTSVLADPLQTAMESAASEQAFERAATLRDRLATVRSFHETGAAAVHDPEDDRSVDVLGVMTAEGTATVARLHSERGKLVDRQRHSVVLPADGPTTVSEVLAAFIPQYYAERQRPDLLLVPERPGDDDLEDWLAATGVDLRVPGAGREARLVDLAMKNARDGDSTADAAAEIAAAVGRPQVRRIEAFDVSHSHGTDVVGSNVVFVDGEPDRSAYRRKRLADDNDDYANMHALLAWRATRAGTDRESRPDPDLLVIDGGLGQLDAAVDALTAEGFDVPAVSIAKGEDGDQLYAESGPLDVSQAALQLLTSARDEAHRFAVQYHETLRDSVSTPLDHVEGIGPTLRNRLLSRFGSVDAIRAAPRDELEAVSGVGAETADRLQQL